jgi:fatty-acyl-CoA synthase
VVLKPNQKIDEEVLLQFIRQKLARYKVPKSVVFVDQLPKTGANKVDKKLLANTYGSEEII